jgi:diguanylate cyclase (GGDEF)-like protein/PAS domain S-box-containing protein
MRVDIGRAIYLGLGVVLAASFVVDLLVFTTISDLTTRVVLRWLALSTLWLLGIRMLIERLRRAADALRLSEVRFQRLAEATIEGVVVHDNGTVVEMNPAAEALFGRSADDMIGRSILEFVAPEAVASVLSRVLSQHEELYEATGLRADGTRFPLEVLGRRLPRAGRTMRVVSLRDISAKRRAEQAAQLNEARYRHLVEQAADGIFVADESGRVIDVNPAGCELLLYPREDILGHGLWKFLPPTDVAHQPVRTPDEASGGVFRSERRMLRRDGTTIDVDVCVSRLADGAMLGMVRDVTDQKAAAAALRDSEERYRLLVEASPLPIGVHSEGKIVYMNSAAMRIAGASRPEDIVAKPMLDFVHPDYRAMVAERARRALIEGVGAPPAEAKFLRLDGDVLDVEMASMPIQFKGKPAVQVVMHDVTERKRAEDALRYEALHDRLTGLANRIGIDARFHELIEANSGVLLAAALMLDLDRFKEINDALGHRFGDAALCEVARRWQRVIGNDGLLGRLSGDEFLVVMAHSDVERARSLGGALQHALDEPFVIESHRFSLGVSVGISIAPDDAANPEELLRHADMAMYAAKQAGSGCLVYQPQYERHRPDQLALISELRDATTLNQLVLHYQPQVRLHDGSVDGVEALIRWQHPTRGLLSPEHFVPFAESTGLIGSVTRWVLDEALRRCRMWSDQGMDLSMSVNVSMRDLQDGWLPTTIQELLDLHGVSPDSLKIEITESTFMANPAGTSQVLNDLRRLGVKVSMDDFGTGYSSLAYLKNLPVDELKLDRTFVRDLPRTRADHAIVKAAVALGRDLGLTLVAEGVEDEQTLRILRSLGCDLVQGFEVSRPLPPVELEAWLRSRNNPAEQAA